MNATLLERTVRNISLSISPRHPLVTVEFARIELGVGAEMVVEAIEEGRIAWAFDIASSAEARRRELRIWTAALLPEPPDVDLPAVVNSIIGTSRVTLHGSEIERLLLCFSFLVKSLHDRGEITGEIVGHTRLITRVSLAAFLARRHVA